MSCVSGEAARAGMSASNWVVAVNGQSVASRTIANHYCAARNLSPRNVVVLNGIPDSDQITVDQFRELILRPLIETIEKRGLANQIQGIAYSADFPTAIDIQADIASLQNKSPYLTPVGSINGLTFLYRQVLAKDPSYIGFESNLYACRPASRLFLPLLPDEQAKSFKTLLDESKHLEAAELLQTAIQALDTRLIFPMQYLEAQQWSKANEPERALKALEASIRNGWVYREHLLNDPVFASIAEDKDFQRIAKRCPEQKFDYFASRSFDARTFYSINMLGSGNPKYGSAYLLSMTLSVTRDLGITKSEAIRNLQASAQADFSQPDGEFVFTKTSDVRTKTREPSFAFVLDALKARGKRASIVESTMPLRGKSYAGVMMGTPDFAWASSGATLLPGSIAENLTSLGGAMTTSSQTKCTEFLRFGAAASSGAVTEPYSIQNKFPHPMIHVHYVDGLTAAEAFYSSVTCPYQLLIVGDPLCQPFADPPRFTLKHTLQSKKLAIAIQMQDQELDSELEPESIQLYVDGILRGQSPYDPSILLNLDGAKLGQYEVRVAVLKGQRVQQTFEQSLTFVLDDSEGQLIRLSGPDVWRLSDEKPLQVRIEKHAREVTILQGLETLGTIKAGETSLELLPSQVGYGPVKLYARAQLESGTIVESESISIQIDP
jgi:hypothetical protein